MRKFRRVGIVLLATAFCATAFSACTNYQPKRDVDITETFYLYRSPYEQPEGVDGCGYREKHAYYIFQSDISPKTRDDVMDTAEEIFERFGYSDINFYTVANCITGYVDAEMIGNSQFSQIRDNEIFLCLDDFSPVYITLACNQKMYGADISYGLLYALSYGQCAEWGYSIPKRLTDEQIAQTVREYPAITTFNTAVFQTDFASAEMKRAAEGLAVKLYEQFGVEELEKIVLSDNPNQATDILIDSICYSLGVQPLIFDPLYEYKMYQTGWYVVTECADVRVFMSKTYRDLCYPYFDSLEDYYNLLQALPEQIAELKKYMYHGYGTFFDRVPRLEILYDGYFFMGPEWEGFDIAGLTCIDWVECASVFCTVHELTHLLSHYFSDGDYINSDTLNAWTAEAFPSYSAARFDAYFLAEYERLVSTKGNDEVLRIFNEIYANYTPLNVFEFFDILAYVYESAGFDGFYDHSYENNPKLLEPTAVSLVNYLIETYGKDKFMDLYYTHGATEESVYGKDFYALRQEWFESLKARFKN